MIRIKELVRPSGLGNALKRHADSGGQAMYLAGGTDVLVVGRGDKYAEKTLIDISKLEELRGIWEEDGRVMIGAMSTHSEIQRSHLIRNTAMMLAEGAGSVGSPQIRNRGTIGGNVANASPAADTLAPLAALRTTVILQGLDGKREVPLEKFIFGAYQTDLRSGEIVTALAYHKPAAGSKSCYVKLGRRNALAITRISAAALARVDTEGKVTQMMLSMGSVFSSPMAFPAQEAMLLHEKPTSEKIREAAKAVGEQMIKITGYRWSSEYKLPACVAICEEALNKVLLQGGETV